MAGSTIGPPTVVGIPDPDAGGHEIAVRGARIDVGVDVSHRFGQVGASNQATAQRYLRQAREHRRVDAVAGNVQDDQGDSTIGQRKGIVQVAGDVSGGTILHRQLESADFRGELAEQVRLDPAGFFELLLLPTLVPFQLFGHGVELVGNLPNVRGARGGRPGGKVMNRPPPGGIHQPLQRSDHPEGHRQVDKQRDGQRNQAQRYGPSPQTLVQRRLHVIQILRQDEGTTVLVVGTNVGESMAVDLFHRPLSRGLLERTLDLPAAVTTRGGKHRTILIQDQDVMPRADAIVHRSAELIHIPPERVRIFEQGMGRL